MRAWLGVTAVLLAAGCSGQPCTTTTQCGSGEVCSNERCQALDCEQTFSAIDPADGQCKPVGACAPGAKDWVSCADPCTGLGEFACVKDPRCQPVYTAPTAPTGSVPCANDGPFNGGSPGCAPATETFVSCRANPINVAPCSALDEAACAADPRCIVEQLGTGGGCGCPLDSGGNVPCSCPPDNAPTFDCRDKSCFDYSPIECLAHAECTTSPTPIPGVPCNCPAGGDCACGGVAGSGTTSGGSSAGPAPKSEPVPPGQNIGGCYPRYFGCSGMDEATCLAHAECHPVGTSCYCPPGATCKCSGGTFQYCEADDGLSRCDSDSDCDPDQRCNNDEACAPPNGSGSGGVAGGVGSTGPVPAGSTGVKSDPVASSCAGLCVAKGCAGYGEKKCNADPSCEAVYMLECSPYGGGGLDVICGAGQNGPTPPPNGGTGGGAPVSCGGPCEPSFVQCKDGGVVNGVVPERSVLVRDPFIVDDPLFSFTTVMGALAGGKDVNTFVTAWLHQITVDSSANGRVAPARTAASDFLATLPHVGGNLDAGKLGFQVTSLSNRLDLAGPHDCGEARVTYALSTGLNDRRHRMTVIVELRQPDDGANCRTVASQWLALSSLQGAQLAEAIKLIYLPLLNAATLNQVRTNEFLVGPQTGPINDPTQAWQLREWRLGSDGLLHLAASKQQLDPNVVNDVGFQSWLDQNQAAVTAGKAILPDAYLAITSSEDGNRIFLPTDQTGDLTLAMNKIACAGCHTTESNTAFAHVAERFGGTGQATISQFLEEQLPSRALHVWSVAHGGFTSTYRNSPHSVH
jgi:hypothetical protein